MDCLTVYYACREAESKTCYSTVSTIERDGWSMYIKAEKVEHTHSSSLLNKRTKE